MFHLPNHAFRLYMIFKTTFLKIEPTDPEMRASELLEFVYYLNFSSNFFIYSLCMRSFRKATRKMFSKSYATSSKLTSQCYRYLDVRCRCPPRIRHNTAYHPSSAIEIDDVYAQKQDCRMTKETQRTNGTCNHIRPPNVS